MKSRSQDLEGPCYLGTKNPHSMLEFRSTGIGSTGSEGHAKISVQTLFYFVGLIYLSVVCVCTCMCIQCTWKGQRTTGRSQFSPFPMKSYESNSGHSGLRPGGFTWQAICISYVRPGNLIKELFNWAYDYRGLESLLTEQRDASRWWEQQLQTHLSPQVGSRRAHWKGGERILKF